MDSDSDGERQRVVFSSGDVSGRDSQGSSLVPMLAAGLVLITVGAIMIMTFV